MEKKQKFDYTAPQMEVVPVVLEAVICSSPDGTSDENMVPVSGTW